MRIFFTTCSLFIFFASISNGQSIRKIILNESNEACDYYLALEPQGSIDGVLVLLAGFGEPSENIFPESKLFNVAYANNLLTIAWAAGNKLYADSIVQSKLSQVLTDVIKKYKLGADQFVLGGYSAGGAIVLRYTELCVEFPGNYPIQPKGVFAVDSPIDIFQVWKNLETSAKNKYSDIAVEEALGAMKIVRSDHGAPFENSKYYSRLTPFSLDKKYVENERWLKDIAVRTYHEVDVEWRLTNRNQSVEQSNYYISSEFINRLILLGNKRAAFIQSDIKGYRSNGARHPHSWSIVDEVDCIMWVKSLL